MSYGRSFPTVLVPMTFQCGGCKTIVTIQVDAGKDYIYEDTCREAERRMVDCCDWLFWKGGIHCSDCREEEDKKEITCDECGAECFARCYTQVPGKGTLCVPCHKEWQEKEDHDHADH